MALSILWVLSNRGAWVSRGVASRPLRGLGALSYGIYVWHPVVMVLVLHDVDPIIVIGQGETDALVNATFIMYILGTLGLAALTYLLIERPFLELKQWLRAGHVSSQPAQRTLGSWIRAYLDIVSVGVVSAIGVVIAALSLQVQFGAATHDRLQALLPIDLTPRAMIAPATEAHFADAPRVSPGVVHADAGIRERRVVPGDVVLLARDGGLVEVQADGTASRLLAKDGETVRVTNLGAWDARRQRLSGLDAVFQTGRWNVPLGDAARATTAWGFTESAANWQREGWSVNPPTVAFTLLHEDGAAFARLTATSGESTIHVRGTRPATRLDGAPLTVRARIRTNRRDVSASLSVHDFVRAGNPNVTIRTLNTSTHWADEILRVGPMHDPHRDDNYSLVVEGLGDGDWVDVAHLSAYIGILP